jgi:isochorismate hydrolase
MTRSELIRAVPEAAWRSADPDPARAALLLVDMQEFFRSMAEDIIPRLGELAAVCRVKGIPVLFTRHGHTDPAEDGGMLGAWWGDLIVEGSAGWHLVDELAPQPGDSVLPKKRYSAFFGTDLDETLEKAGVRDLIIGGVMTNLCCETTARDAFVRDYRVFFLADGTATADETYHIATLRNLAFGFAYMALCEEICEL